MNHLFKIGPINFAIILNEDAAYNVHPLIYERSANSPWLVILHKVSWK